MTVWQPELDSPARRWAALAAALLAAAAIGLADYLTGFEIALASFYLVPVGVAAWLAGRSSGLVVALASALFWLWADLHSGRPYTHAAIPPWNALVRFASFVVVAFTLASLRRALRLAHTDELTRLPNARAFMDRLAVELRRSARYQRPLAIAYLDIDGFKQVNDRHGHQAGDQLLRVVGETLRSATRSNDMAARLGGDEFAVLLVETGFDEARSALDHLYVALDGAARRRGYPVSFSIGAASLTEFSGSAQAAIRAVDALMYEAKHSPGTQIRHVRMP
jgi:diguanylate cyclase (GGDEF)-like protein